MSAVVMFLLRPGRAVDTETMIAVDMEQLFKNADWQLVLSAYHAQHSVAKEQNPEHDGWLPRTTSVEGIRDERLPRIHGKLIALGFLKFELAGRTAGVRYQLSRLGIQAMSRINGTEDDSDPFDLAQSA